MKLLAILLSCALYALVGLPAHARPLIIENSAVLENPDPARYPLFGYEMATNGTDTLVLAESRSDPNLWHHYVLRFQRSGGTWAYRGEILHTQTEYDGDTVYPSELALRGDLAVIELQGTPHAYRLTATGLVDLGNLGGYSNDIEIEGNRVAWSIGEAWHAQVADLNSDGTWTSTFLQGQPRQPDDENWGGPVDLSGDYVIIGTPQVADLEPQEIPIYHRTGPGAWQLQTKLEVPPGESGLGSAVAVRGLDAIVDDSGGAYVWRLPYPGDPVDRLQAIDELSHDPALPVPEIEKSADLVGVQRWSGDRRVGVVNLFRTDAAGRYQQAATLVAKNGVSLTSPLDIVGNTAAARGDDTSIYIFDLPTNYDTPAAHYEDFEGGAATGWTPQSGAQFSVAGNSSNHVWRQASLAGDARALLGNTSWRDQAIEADIRPTEFSGSDRWVGLITRYQDAQNFTYVTLRSSGTVQLRRLRDGSITELARAPLAVSVNRNYHTRLESVGSTHRVYVDGKLLLEVDDSSPVQAGSAGIAMYRARADYDNVVVSPSPRTTLFANDFTGYQGDWTQTGTGSWTKRDATFAQDSVGGDARATIGTPTDDQVVQASVRPIAYAAAAGSQQRWTGILARYRDTQNYYYLSLRRGNSVSLRKVVNGTITVLRTAPFTVNLNTPYQLRIEAVGNQLRGYVNGALLVQARDDSLPSGSAGLVTYKAAATFDDYVAYQP